MNALDTNVLIRFLVADDKIQAQKVYDLFKRAEAGKEQFWVPLTVVLEIIWVLESVYAIPRKEIIGALHELLMMPILKFELHSAIKNFVVTARESTFDLSDILIAHSAKIHGCNCVLTFDKKASDFRLFRLIE